jgi:hypothetical protein
MRVRAVLLAAVSAISLLFAQPASAIVYGVPDGGEHPYVGGVVYNLGGSGDLFVGCTGTLIGPTTFLTAAHCYPDEFWQLVGVTFDAEFVPGESEMVSLTDDAFEGNPNYDGTPYTDIAVIVLPSDPGVGYAALPEVGLLDTMAPSFEPGNQARDLTAVGYGTTGLNRGSGEGRPYFEYPQVRLRAENRIIGLNSDNTAGVLVQTTAAPGTGGGTCYGDSGGPFFVQGTNIVVAITITGFNSNCGGADLSLRIDIPLALDFLSRYVPV